MLTKSRSAVRAANSSADMPSGFSGPSSPSAYAFVTWVRPPS